MTAPIKTCDYCCAVGVMPTFMDGETVCYDCLPTLPKTMREARREVVSLRAKIEQMERQEPVALVKWQIGGPVVHLIGDVKPGDILYAIPGAQTAPSVPEGWQLVPVEPTREMVMVGEDAWDKQLDARLDGSTRRYEWPSEQGAELCARVAYRAMLAAAPKTSTQGEEK